MSFLNKLKPIYEYIKLMGFDWFIFRLKYELLKKANYFDKVNETIIKIMSRQDKNSFAYSKIGLVNFNYKGDESFLKKADNAMDGKIFSFSNEYLDYQENNRINWQMNPITKVKANRNMSWNRLSDFGEYGDIKLIWEISRFPQVYYFINAYSITQDAKYANACINQIVDWIKNNPFPNGVNYKCGQEISFRIISWIVVLEYFVNFVNKKDEKIIIENIYTSFLRINANIDYAAKSVKNNHSISEASGLFVIGLLFPQFKESKKLIQKSLKYLLKETSYQIYKDGSYIQHSFTYQRLALDVLSFVFIVAKNKNYELPIELKQRYQKMVEFLYSFIQNDGCLPNYGSNDGANLFPISGANYRDFRDSLNLSSVIVNNKSLYEDSQKLVEFFNLDISKKIKLDKKIEFNDGGYYILKNENIFSFIRCHSYKDRPASNDMFHLDIWYKGKNILCDAGSYSYNTNKSFKNNFIGVTGHNTIMINDSNQMQQVLNFGWANWTKAKCIEFNNNKFIGENYAYQQIFGITQQREVNLEKQTIIIIDNIKGISNDTNIKQIFNTKSNVEKIDNYALKVDNCIISSNVEYKIENTYVSDYYNSYVEGNKIVFEINSQSDFEIKTRIEFKD
jgi:hypothetical protein